MMLQMNKRIERQMSLNSKRDRAMIDININDILYSSWGYEQTNIDYYQVVRKTAKKLWVRKLKSTRTETGFMSGPCVPHPNEFISQEFSIFPDKYKKWQGRPLTCSWYA